MESSLIVAVRLARIGLISMSACGGLGALALCARASSRWVLGSTASHWAIKLKLINFTESTRFK